MTRRTESLRSFLFRKEPDDTFREVRVPHDWAIGADFSEQNDVSYRDDGTVLHTGMSGALPLTGTGIYRTEIFLPEEERGRRVFLEFDGVMNSSEIFWNGELIGKNHFGYLSFCVDATAAARFGCANTLEVRATVQPHSTRWYSGAGIFRPVRLVVKDPVHLRYSGVRVVPELMPDGDATVKIALDTAGDPVGATGSLFAPDGSFIAALSGNATELTGRIAEPLLWSMETPNLYRAHIALRNGAGEITDETDVRFGIRKAAYSPTTGLTLNGKPTRLQGVCLHHDLGLLGAAFNRSGLIRQFRKLREMGVNAIRTSHNPPAPGFLDLCDEMGFWVIDEFFDEWRQGKCQNGYHVWFDEHADDDVRTVIRRDRNHPSVMMWSIGNEIPEQKTDDGWVLARRLCDLCHEEDPTRPVTIGINLADDAIANRFAGQVDVIGFNYQCKGYERFHREHPSFIFYGSETESAWSSRGEYKLPVKMEGYPDPAPIRDDRTVTAYEVSTVRWGYPAEREFYYRKQNPNVLGSFSWTGFDYLGEPIPYDAEWPARSSYFGVFDLAGLPKDRFWLFRSEWTDEPVLHLFPHWNWEGMEGKPIEVHCFTSFRSVELFVNGKSCGIRRKDPESENELERFRLIWKDVPYKPGTLRAVAYDDYGKILAEDVRQTAGKPEAICLCPEDDFLSADPDDVLFVRVSVKDASGIEHPTANDLIAFTAEHAVIVGSDNGDQRDVNGLFRPDRNLFNGLCVVAIRSDGSDAPAILYATAPECGGAIRSTSVTLPKR